MKNIKLKIEKFLDHLWFEYGIEINDLEFYGFFALSGLILGLFVILKTVGLL